MFAYFSPCREVKGEALDTTSDIDDEMTDDWCQQHFDHLSPALAANLQPTLTRMRSLCPVTHSDRYDGFWVFTRYEDVLHIAQDWRTFSSAEGVSVPGSRMVVPAIPEHIDPPMQRVYKRLINAHLTPEAVAGLEGPTRRLVTRLIDGFIEDGECDFMEAFARPFPGAAFFELVLHAPSDEVAEINRLSTRASVPTNEDARASWEAMHKWIVSFVDDRRRRPPMGDIVDAVLGAEIDGRPITEDEVLGIITLLILGGLDTTSGALGHFVIRFCREPGIPDLLRTEPELIPAAVEELLRLEGPFIAIARTAVKEAEVGGRTIQPGEKVLVYWASANRDESEFPDSARFDPARPANRHIAFGAGPHRCAGSHLARMNLRIALEELTRRVRDLRLAIPESSIPFHSALNRSPLSLPVAFTPGPR
jgi:cytochrome P450